MKTKTIHGSNFGGFDPQYGCERVMDGYITYHESDRYENMPTPILRKLAAEGRSYLVRNACVVEFANRAVQQWRDTGHM